MDPLIVARLKWSRTHHLRSLHDLSLRTVVNNLPYYSEQDQPFADLPLDIMPSLLEQVSKILILKGKKCDADIARTFISWNLTSLKLFAYPPDTYPGRSPGRSIDSEGKVEKLLNEMEAMELDHLEDLSLEMTNLPPGCLTPLTSFGSLQSIQISVDVGATDSVLQFIGANLPLLKSLTFTKHVFSDNGLRFLCFDDGIHGKCKQLRKLSIDMTRDPRITQFGIMSLLVNLPVLRYIGCSDYTFTCVLTYAKAYPNQILHLRGIVSSHFSTLKCTSQSDLEVLFNTCPNIERLQIVGNIPIAVELLNEVSCKEFIIEFDENQFSFDVHNFLEVVGHKITYLKLAVKSYVIDVSILAKYCPNIVTLNYEADSEKKMMHNAIFTIAFNELQNITIADVSKDHPFPAAAIYAILCSKKLAYACFYMVTNLTNELIDEVYKAALRNPEILLQLNQFVVYSLNTTQLTNESLKKLIACSPKDISSCFSNHTCNEIQRFLKSIRPWEEGTHSIISGTATV